MRVMHVIEAMHRGGAESLVVEHARHAAPSVKTIVCALNRGGPALEAAAATGVETVLLEKQQGHPVAGRLGAVRRLAGLMRARAVDVVNGHNPTGGLYATAAAMMARVPVAMRTEHSPHYRGRHSGLYPALEAMGTLAVRRVICVCEAVRESHACRAPWGRDRFVTVLNGVPEAPPPRPRAGTRTALGVPPEAPLALAIGSLTPQKAQHILVEAFADVTRALPGAVLLIAGEGPLRGPLESRIAARGLVDRVRLLGDRGDVADLLEACDVFVLPSVREGLSVTLLEAMRAGRPSVATRVGGNAEAVVEGETGLLVAPEDPAALAAALERLLGDPAAACVMGAAARRRWAERFTVERMVRETEALYRAMLIQAGREVSG